MASQSAVWASNLRILHSFSREIRFWHSRGLVSSNLTRKFSKIEFGKKTTQLKVVTESWPDHSFVSGNAFTKVRMRSCHIDLDLDIDIDIDLDLDQDQDLDL